MPSACWSVFGNLFQRVGAASRNDTATECFLFVFSPNPEMLSLHLRSGAERRARCNARENKFPWRSFMHALHGYVKERI